MFKFKEYPEIEKHHKIYKNLVQKYYDYEINSKGKGKEYDINIDSQLYKDIENYICVYAKVIYDFFYKDNPKIYNAKYGKYYGRFQKVFGADFSKLNIKDNEYLVSITEENGIYKTENKYYNKVSGMEFIQQKHVLQEVIKALKENGCEVEKDMIELNYRHVFYQIYKYKPKEIIVDFEDAAKDEQEKQAKLIAKKNSDKTSSK